MENAAAKHRHRKTLQKGRGYASSVEVGGAYVAASDDRHLFAPPPFAGQCEFTEDFHFFIF